MARIVSIMLVNGLERCPDCHCDLTALAPPGRCPACGFEFDQHTRVWRARRSWQHYAVIYGLVGLTTGLLAALAERIAVGEVENALLPILTGLCVGVLGLLLHRVLTGRLSGRFVALTPAGILVGTRRRSRLIPWADVRRLATRERVPKLELHSTSVPLALEDILERPEDLAAFKTQVAEAQQRRAEGHTPTGGSHRGY